MTNLSYPEIRRRLRASLPVLIVCLALPAAVSAEATGQERISRTIGDDTAELSDQPISLMTEDVSGAPGEAIPLAVTVSAKAGRSVSSTYLVGLPKGANLADADHELTAADETIIDVTDWDLPRLSVMLPSTQAGTYTLTVVAVSRPDNGALNFTRSTFTLNATAESREPAFAPELKRPDAAVLREALRPPEAAPQSATGPSNEAMQIGDITPKMVVPVTDFTVPKAPANLWRARELGADTEPPAVAVPGSVDRRPAEFRPAATLAAPPAFGAPPAVAPAIAPPPATPLAPAAEMNVKALVERAERLIGLGDISGARLVLERAADRGDSRANFLLAQTWDPHMLRAWKVQGLKPDPDRARALYAKAGEEGLREPKPVNGAMR